MMTQPLRRPGGIPRGLARTGPILFSYPFRPFFLGGAIWAVVAMVLWLMALAGRMDPGGEYGASYWHMHEMLFGFTSAVLSGFLMTAVPNWTGRLPVSGPPLMALSALWLAGRLAITTPVGGSTIAGIVIESLFLPVMAIIFLAEIVAGRKWRDLKVVGVVAVLAIANIGFHVAVLSGSDPSAFARAAIAGFVLLILIVGGRITPSFTRNWLNRQGRAPLPVPFGWFDELAASLSTFALVLWMTMPETVLTAVAAFAAATLNVVRLWRWRGWKARAEPLILSLHLSYMMVCLGFAAIGMAALGGMTQAAALHVFAVGAIGGEMLAVMTRATRGHTGRPLQASTLTTLSYLAIFTAALSRPAADFVAYEVMISIAGAAWIIAFGLFVLEHTGMLVTGRRDPRGA